ncbi:MAG: hypothetical protein GY862_13145 [Gammaproteobacteria bacterium]|nr:hypothetical protein [Gammaproteobacteria bacterium]
MELQYSLAASQDKLQKTIWMPPDLEPRGETQKMFIQTLQQDDASPQRNTDLLQTDIEELKITIWEKLKPSGDQTSLDSEVPWVYLIYTQQDQETIKALDDYIFNTGLEVIKPLFDGSESQLNRDHKAQLKECDAVMIYYGFAPEFWFRKNLLDVRNALKDGRTQPFRTRAIYLAPPETDRKKDYRTHEKFIVIKTFENFDVRTPASSFKEFINACRNG